MTGNDRRHNGRTFLAGAAALPPDPPPANYEGLRPSNSLQEIGKTIGADL